MERTEASNTSYVTGMGYPPEVVRAYSSPAATSRPAFLDAIFDPKLVEYRNMDELELRGKVSALSEELAGRTEEATAPVPLFREVWLSRLADFGGNDWGWGVEYPDVNRLSPAHLATWADVVRAVATAFPDSELLKTQESELGGLNQEAHLASGVRQEEVLRTQDVAALREIWLARCVQTDRKFATDGWTPPNLLALPTEYLEVWKDAVGDAAAVFPESVSLTMAFRAASGALAIRTGSGTFSEPYSPLVPASVEVSDFGLIPIATRQGKERVKRSEPVATTSFVCRGALTLVGFGVLMSVLFGVARMGGLPGTQDIIRLMSRGRG